MKYIIDVEKIEGTNLWKAKEFNTLVFDKNGLMRMISLEDELGDYYGDLREEIYRQKREIDLLVKNHKKLRDEKTELKEYNNRLEKDFKDFDNICSRLKIENADLKVDLKDYKAVCKVAFEDMDGLKNENKALAEQNSLLEDELKDFEELCTKLSDEKAELLKKYDEKCLQFEMLLDKFPKEENVPIEEVVETDEVMTNADKFKKVFGYYATEMWSKSESEFIDWINSKYTSIEKVVDEDTVVRLMTNQFEHSEREYGRLLHKIKCQKGMLKKQGKDISKLQKENNKFKTQLKKRDEEYEQMVWSNSIYKNKNKNLSIENEKLKNIICFGKD